MTNEFTKALNETEIATGLPISEWFSRSGNAFNLLRMGDVAQAVGHACAGADCPRITKILRKAIKRHSK